MGLGFIISSIRMSIVGHGFIIIGRVRASIYGRMGRSIRESGRMIG